MSAILTGPGDCWCPPSYFMDDDMTNCEDCGGSFLDDELELYSDELLCHACHTKRIETEETE